MKRALEINDRRDGGDWFSGVERAGHYHQGRLTICRRQVIYVQPSSVLLIRYDDALVVYSDLSGGKTWRQDEW